jgi:hypothetical protein
MKIIQTILKTFITNDKKILGRLEIDHCIKKTDRKIELSNEDHCGPCGQYVLNKTYEVKDYEIKKNNVL